ncbi:MAG: GAF domain-containing sensor histidine kinase [Chloroflexota bacterium]
MPKGRNTIEWPVPVVHYRAQASLPRDQPLAASWISALLEIYNLSQDNIAQLSKLSTAILNILAADPEVPAAIILQQSREAGRHLSGLSLPIPKTLEQSLLVLSRELHLQAADPERVSQIITGLATGYSETLIQDSRVELAAVKQELTHQIAERLRTETDLRGQAERLYHLHDVHLDILSAKSLNEIIDRSFQLIDTLIPNLSASLGLYNFEINEYVVLNSNHSEFVGVRKKISFWEMVNHLKDGKVYYVEDLPEKYKTKPGLINVVKIDARSLLNVPLLYQNELIGSLTLTSNNLQGFSPDELIISREIANSLAVAIQHQRLLDNEKSARERETSLREITASITLDLELENVLDAIVDQLERVLPTASSSIMLLEESKLVIKAARQLYTEEQPLREMISRNPANLIAIMQTGQPELIKDTRLHPTWVTLPGGGEIRCWIGVPLNVKGIRIGILTLDRNQPNTFSQADLDLAMAFANQAAIVIENARLFREVQLHAGELEAGVRERTRELQALYGITAAAAEEMDLETVLKHSLEYAMTAFNCSAGCLFLIDEDNFQLESATRMAFGDQKLVELIERLSIDDLQPYQSLLMDKPLVINNFEAPWQDMSDDVQAYAGAPLRSRGRPLGFLSLLSVDPDHFASDPLPLLTTIADQIGAAVENIRLRNKAREAAILGERDRLARDLHDAVTQSLYSLSLFAEAGREAALASDIIKVQRHIQSVLRLAHQALGELRLMLFELRSETTAHKGLAEALKARLQTVEERVGIIYTLNTNQSSPLPLALEEAFYRVGLEALTNALRHSQATEVQVDLHEKDQQLTLIVADNGLGFDFETAAQSGGFGLNSMTSRMEQVGGRLLVTTAIGHGTQVEARAILSIKEKGQRGVETIGE